jgi:F0F1-type ATP synthase assembly protein I
MNVVKIQFLLLILGAIVAKFLGFDYLSYISGNLSVALPTLLFALVWSFSRVFTRKNGLFYLTIASLVKIFLVLLILFLVIKHQIKLQPITMFIGFILACKAYLLAGLVLKKR